MKIPEATSTLDFAANFAFSNHEGQVDRGGHSYHHHLTNVYQRVRDEELPPTIHPLISPRKQLFQHQAETLAFLHDIVEDTEVTLDNIEELFGVHIRDAVDAITRRETETYRDYIQRCKENPLARHVKLMDLKENMDLSRIAQLTDKDFSLQERYRKALHELAYDLAVL